MDEHFNTLYLTEFIFLLHENELYIFTKYKYKKKKSMVKQIEHYNIRCCRDI